MTLFWIAAVVLVVLSLVLLFPALRRYKSSADDEQLVGDGRQQAELNKGIYRERLTELEAELANGELEQASFDAMVLELKSSLLDDVDSDLSATVKSPSSDKHLLAWGIGVVMLVAVPAIWYWQFGAYQQVTHWQNVHSQLQQYIQRGVMQQGEALSETEMRDFALALRTELHHKPTDDPSVWLLLGRVGMAVNDGELAMASMERAYELAPTNPSVALGYAQVAMYAQDPQVVHRGARILDALIAHEPNNLDALSLKAFQAFEQGDHGTAATVWRKMATLLPADDPRKATIERTLRMVEMPLAQGGAASPATSPAAAASKSTPVAEAAAPQSKEVQGQQLSVVVKLAPELRSQLPTNGNLVVFARAKDGPPMPLAVKRMPLGNFPVKVVLSDSDAMMPAMKLSSFPEVYVTARISVDQDVKLSAGELEGIGDALSLNGEPYATSVTINTKH
ncbi:c-type cytochrome biogenesis protein CcmI [Corallincola holothuriorum]|uniref:C-type cytochrome biogenesis protein CcmI n=1 Tax=Corallincola holothuriorum TaxID=2282215 RepID=A0A368N4U0_9GAMM|nr:c-type cytochrome biogenesis protein CcmI [Corallincola holothuriorum]RCU44535.1 c-type cytochrome biogenesis protein CcmI [Corallincola holothuriorum]